MTFKVQHVKYLLCGLLYVVACFLLVNVRRTNFAWPTIRMNSRLRCTSNASLPSAKFVPAKWNFETKLLEYDDLLNKSVNQQDTFSALQRISETCTKFNLSAPLVRRHFLYDREHKAMYCWIRKAASTSFTKLFSDMRKRKVTHDYYREVDILAPESEKILGDLIKDSKIFKLLIVRHPFERLVSSYRDRIEDNSRYTAQAWIYAQKIFHLTRPHLFVSNKVSGNVLKKIFGNNKRLQLVPTFKEFVTWLLQENSVADDVHWSQYHSHCSICDINYNFVLKLEQCTSAEIGYIFSKLGLRNDKAYLPNLEKTHGGLTDFQRTCNYFKSLTQDTALRLYERYKVDFEMFNYEFDKYVECAKGDV